MFVAALTTRRGDGAGGGGYLSNCDTVVKVTASHAQALAMLGLVDSGEVDIHPGADAAGGRFNFLEVRLKCRRGVCDDCALCANSSPSWWAGCPQQPTTLGLMVRQP